MKKDKPPFCVKRFCWKFSIISAEITAAIAVFVLGLALVFVWRVSTSPIDLEFARPKLEQALSNQENDITVSMDQLILHWPDRRGPLLLGLRNGHLRNSAGQTIVKIKEASIGLSLPHLLIGQIVPTSLILNQPKLDVIHTEGGQWDVGFKTGSDEIAAPDDEAILDVQNSILENIIGYVGKPGSDSGNSSLSALERFEISDAHVTIDDRIAKSQWSLPHLDVLLKSQDTGLTAKISANLYKEREETPHVKVSAIIPWESEQLLATININDVPVSFFADKAADLDILATQDIGITATLAGQFNKDLKPLEISVAINSPEGSITVPKYREETVGYRDFDFAGSYNHKRGLVIDDLSAVVSDIPLTMTAEAAIVEGGYQAKANVVIIDSLQQSSIEPLWPISAKESSAYRWVVGNLSKGSFTNARADITAFISDDWTSDLQSLSASFDYSDMTINYRAPMVPITQANGSGSFDYHSELLNILVDDGKVGALTLGKSQVELAHILEGGKGHADVNVSLNGGLRDVFAFLEKEPIGFDHGYKLDRIQGTAALQVNLGIPANSDVEFSDIDMDVRGTIKSGLLPSVLDGTDLTSANASVIVQDNDITVSGKGKFLTEPVTFKYQGVLESKDQKVKETITVSGKATENLRRHFGIDLSSFLSGPAATNISYINYGAQQTIDVKADLTAARIIVEPFSYEKVPGQKASTTLQIKMLDKTIQTIKKLNVTAPDLAIHDGTLNFTKHKGETFLSGGNAPRMQLLETNGSVEFKQGFDEKFDIKANLNTLDLRPLLEEKDTKNVEEDGTAMVVSLTAQYLLTHENFGGRDSKIYVDLDKKGSFNQLEMDATVGGGTLYLRYKPDEITGKRNFRFEADDAGSTLKAFGLYDKIVGGKILIHAEPINGILDRSVIGVAEITNFEVVGAPALAKVLSLMSLGGLSSAGKSGIQFARLESKFDWLYRPQGSLLSLQGGRTSGAAVGLTFDGVVDQAEGTMNISGTIIPVSNVNNAIKSIPVLGQILTGGSGLFAATYSVKGDTKNPKVSVNPLSVLAPGIVRKILFE